MKKIIYFLSGCLFTAVLMCSISAFAETINKIDVIFGRVNLVVNGEKVDKETLLYNGATYVPLRAVAEILGKEVAWDSGTNTAYIDEAGTNRQEAIDLKSSAKSASSSAASTELFTKKEALNLLFDYLYDDESQADMTDIKFSDTDDFYGYEYRRIINGELADPWRIEFLGISKDSNYYLFWLNEQVYYDGVFDHAVTGNFFAINKATQEIIAQRNGAELLDDWNEEFSW